MKHDATRMIFSYWDSLRGERAAPERGEIDPGEIRHALADTFILEVSPRHHTSIRLAGTRLCALFGGELKGRPFGDLWTEAAQGEIERCIEAVIDDTAGIVAGVTGSAEAGHVLDLEMLLLPLRYRGKTHQRILGALSPASLPTWIGLRSVEALDVKTTRVITHASPVSPILGPAPLAPPPAVVGDPRRRFVVHQGGRG